MKRLALAISAASVATSALAADLPSRYAPPPAPYYDPVPTFAWGGLYAGINGAFAFSSLSGGSPFGNPIGGFGGGTLGYNYQSGNLLIGAEADIAGGYLGSNGGAGLITGSSSINAIGTARARVGYIWDRALIYATGGYAGTSLNGRVADFANAPNILIAESHYLNGYSVGAGVEYAITTKISAKAEYLFNGFGSQTYFGGTADARSISANVHLIRLGLNYHF